MPPSPQIVSGTLQTFFPPNHEDSPWLLRLMIIRDDISFEVEHLALKESDGPEEVWRTVYFLRRLSVSLLEAKNILAHELSTLVKASSDEAMKALGPHLREAISRVVAVEDVLRPLRDSLGAHVRPSNADKNEVSVEARVLRNHPLLEGSVPVLQSTKETSYRNLSQTSLLFAWPDADDDSTLEAKHVALQQAVLSAAGDVMRVADAVLVYHWWRVGAVEPPEGYDFGVRNSEGPGYRPVPRP